MKNLFDINGKVIVITGGCGILGRGIALYLAEQGAKIVILDRMEEIGKELETELKMKTEAMFLVTDVLNKEVLEENKIAILERFNTIDILLNAAGGNMSGATIAPDKTILDLEVDAFKKVVDLNLFGTVLPTMAFVDVMAKNKEGVIVNFCSESALRPLTRVVGYGSAKAAIANYTRYMATELATKFSPEIRVNAIVPGFLLTNQNRALLTKPDGTYTAAPSTSPEHGPIDQGATFVHAVVREILLDAIKASEELGVDKKERKEWEQVLANLVPYKIGRYGQLMEWSVDIDDPKDEHRHVNHLFGLHPGHTVSPVTTPELAEAAKVVLVHRGDGATGWSMGWKLNQWARLQDGNHAYTLFANLLKNGTLDNLWDTHPPFQIDGNFGGTAGITEMLLQSHMGFIQLLPALPDAWKEGSVRGICAKGNFEVDMIWENGLLKEATILSKSGERCIVKYAGKTLSFKTVKGHSYQLKYDSVKGELLKR